MSEKEYNICVNQYSDMLFKFLVRNISNFEVAQDLTQDTFLSLWTKYKEVEFSKAKAFLFICAHNAMVNYFNYAKKQTILQNNLKDKPESFFDNAFEDKNLVNHLVEKLPQVMKECLTLKDLQGFSYKEIAQTMQMSEQNVKNIVFRARIQLRNILKTMK